MSIKKDHVQHVQLSCTGIIMLTICTQRSYNTIPGYNFHWHSKNVNSNNTLITLEPEIKIKLGSSSLQFCCEFSPYLALSLNMRL